MTAPQFVDVSVFNDPSIDWGAYKAWSASGDGVSRVAMRSSYGVGYIDEHFAAYRAGALAAGIDVLIIYHYAYPNFNAAGDEARWQKLVVGPLRPQDMIILDFEEDMPAATAQWALNWLETAQELYTQQIGIYASSYYIQQRLQDTRLAKYPLWLANWQYTPDERPLVPSPWSQYEFVQYTDRATSIPGIAGTVDANIFLGGGSTQVNTYGPGKGDFDQYFIANADGSWTCKKFNMALIGGNLALYRQLSVIPNILPILGLPRTNEIYQHGSDDYAWSVQFFERGLLVYDPEHRQDSQPGLGTSYFGKYEQFIALDPDYKPVVVTALPSSVTTDLQQIATIADKYK